jgi:hypothetical protein
MEQSDGCCCSFRSNSYYMDIEWDPTVQRSNDQICWCLKTQTCLGPDGAITGVYECNPARPCYEEY